MLYRKPNRYISRVFIHCSASDYGSHDDVSVIRKWHLARGWSDVGYHFFITKNGVIQNGRNLERTPAAQRGNNTGTIAICCHGLRIEKFTIGQELALWDLCKSIYLSYSGNVSFHGHCEVSTKSCPVFSYKDWLKLDQFGRMNIRNSK